MNLMTIGLKLAAFGAAALIAVTAHAAITVHTTDFIPDASRTGFNGFESIPNDGTFYTGGPGPYSEGGITVEQINGDPPNDIWVTFRIEGSEGSFGWYPNGGDHGYTKITLTGGGDFSGVGMLASSGGSSPLLAYELLKNGIVVASGTVAHGKQQSFHYVGFSGGGFDTVLLADGDGAFSVRDGHFNAATLDSIELGDGAPKTLAQNIACAADAIAALMPPKITGPAQKNVLLNLLGVAAQYGATPYRSLSLTAVNSVLVRVDGCALRGTPDTVMTHGGAGMDFVTDCASQAPIYACLKDAQDQLAPQQVPR